VASAVSLLEQQQQQQQQGSPVIFVIDDFIGTKSFLPTHDKGQ